MRNRLFAIVIGLGVFGAVAAVRLYAEQPTHCPPPSPRSVENLFAPCLAQAQRPAAETTGQR